MATKFFEGNINFFKAFDKNVMGCQRHKKDVMITMQRPVKNSEELICTDYFFTNEEALELARQISNAVSRNHTKEGPSEDLRIPGLGC